MESKILRLIYDYSIKGRLADSAFIDQLVDIVVNEQQLNRYLAHVNFDSKDAAQKDEITLAEYIPALKVINIYIEKFKTYLNESSNLEYFFNDVEVYFYRNVLITQVILHELEHANQLNIIDHNQGIEHDILKLSSKGARLVQDNGRMAQELIKKGFTRQEIEIYLKRTQQKYIQNYKTAPQERLAEIKSHHTIGKALNQINNYIPRLVLFEEITLLQNMIKGYRDNPDSTIVSPTIYYLYACGYESELKKYDWYDENYALCLEKNIHNYSLADRTLYGLPIYEQEFSAIEEGIQYKLSELR